MSEQTQKESNVEVINKRSDVNKIIDEIFRLLAVEDKKIADSFHELVNELDMKIGITIRKSIGGTKKNYDFLYSAKKPVVRSIFLIKICLTDNDTHPIFGIKANLYNFDSYMPIVEACPNSIKNVIKSTGSCTKCVPQCHVIDKVYTLDGVLYDPCHKKGHNFEYLTGDDWNLLRNLVIEEYKFYTAL